MTGRATRAAPPGPSLAAPRAPRILVPALTAVTVAAVALWLAADAGVEGPGAVPAVARAATAAVVLLIVTGYAPARLLTPHALRPHIVLLVPIFGAASSAVALTALGIARVPFDVSLGALLAAGALGGAWLRLRLGPAGGAASGAATSAAGDEATGAEVSAEALPPGDAGAATPAEGATTRVAWPLYLVVLAALVALIPVFRSGLATVVGQNGDAHLAVGVAELLQEAPPGAVRPELPVDEMPLVWRSKYPIYYELAAVARLAGLDPIEAFATFAAVMLALTGLAFLVLVRYGMRAPPLAGLAVVGLLPFSRLLVYITDHPYYNQLWGTFALPLVLVFGLLYLERPGRRRLGCLALFTALGAAAYPLMLPFPVLVLGIAALVRWRSSRASGKPLGWVSALRLPSGRGALWLWVPAGLLVLAATPAILRGVFEKIFTAAEVVVPWGDISGWQGALGYLPLGRFLGVPDAAAVAIAALLVLAAAAIVALARAPRHAALAVGSALAAGLLTGLYFRLRAPDGDLFFFKTMSFTGALVMAVAIAGVAWLAADPAAARAGLPAGLRGIATATRLRAAGVAGLAALCVLFTLATRSEIGETFDQLTPQLLELRDWSAQLPPGESVRVDLAPSGYQLWAFYMLADRPVSSLRPLVGTIFPFAPPSPKADYLLSDARRPRPPLAAGQPVFENDHYRLYRMKASAPEPDLSSRRMIQPVESIGLD